MQTKYIDFLGYPINRTIQIVTFMFGNPDRLVAHRVNFSVYGSRSLHKIKKIEREATGVWHVKYK